MDNHQLFPFERNRYYNGKLLTSADFETEQRYMNDKRSFLNHALFGSGIVCGLNVIALNESFIQIDSGAAIDGLGREIVVASSVMKKISTVDGYDALKSNTVRLYLAYKEEETCSVYCGGIGAGGKEYEYNHIQEGYTFFLKDVQGESIWKEEEHAILHREMILDSEDYAAYVSMPYTVAKGRFVKISVVVHKKSDALNGLSLHMKLQMPAFCNEEGRHELAVDLDDIQLKKGEVLRKEYWMCEEDTQARETTVLIRKEGMQIQIGTSKVEQNGEISFRVALEEQSPYQLAAREAGKVSLECGTTAREDAAVCIAEIRLKQSNEVRLIEQVREGTVRRYILTPGKAALRHEYASCFRTRALESGIPQEISEESAERVADVPKPLCMSSGRVEIPLDVNMKKGDICYSDEIMHGLGKGNVYVEVGTEFLYDEPHGRSNMRNTIYGNPQLFAFQECMAVETAVRVLNDKGSFQVAVKLLGEQKSIVLQLGWIAVKFSAAKDMMEIQEEKCSIRPETATALLHPKESYCFNVSFDGMEPCQLTYELTEPDSGEIGADGLYTAPAKEGVYEIRIYCTDMPKITTYVYAIVKRK